MSSDYKPVYDGELDSANPDIEGDDDEEEERPVPPLYICLHSKDPRCNDIHPHPPNPTVYTHVTKDTPCRHCGHTGTLRRVN